MFGWLFRPKRDGQKEVERRAAYAKEQARENTNRRLPCGDLVATIKGREYRSHAADCWYDAETGLHVSESVADKAHGLARRLKWAERDAAAPPEETKVDWEARFGCKLQDMQNMRVAEAERDAAQSDLSGLAARTNKLGERE